MKFTSLFLGLSLAIGSVLTHPLDLPFEVSQDELQKRQSTIAITGVTGGGVQPRLEIRQMLNQKPNQWTLLILAMQSYQAQDQNLATGYYQVSGIHGVPRVNWNGVGQCSSCAGTDGYCTHDMILFPAWHRAYLALFEQEFIAVVHSIANSWPTSGASTSRATMQAAASTMRLPYWDWAAAPAPGLNTLPTIISEQYITINGPSGQEAIANPLYQHTFTDSSQLVYGPFVDWSVTYRYPNTDASTASSQDNQATSAFNNIRSSLQEQIYQMFTACDNYQYFSNDNTTSPSCNNLESIHNTVHTTCGGPGSSTVSGGHMTYLSLAAFDPIFWLHHCNVDRYFALWQALHPNSYSATQNAPHDTWTIAAGSALNMNSPLTPFTKDTTGDFWTPNSVRSWNTTFNYNYPEFVDSDGSSAAIASYVNKLYGPSATATAGSSKRTAMAEPVGAADALPTAAAAHHRRVAPPLVAGNGSLFQYTANIQTPRYALNGSYFVFIFLGNPATEQPTSWLQDPALVGPFGVLAQAGMDMGGNDVVVSGSVPLTRTLTAAVQNGTLSNLTEAAVAPYLKKQLQWRISGPNGAEVNPEEIQDFELGVFASTSTQPANEYTLPEWSNFVLLEEITQDKAGGAGSPGTGGGYIGNSASASPSNYGSSSSAQYTVTATTTSSTTICPESESSPATAYSTTSAPTLSLTSYSSATESPSAYSSASS